MKKLLLTIITLSIITLNGCYDPDTATVRINLGNIPIAKHEPKSFIDRLLGLFEKNAYASHAEAIVEKVHIAAYTKNSVIATISLDPEDLEMDDVYDYAELQVPAGEEITFLVVGQQTEYVNDMLTTYAKYYGISNKYTLKAGDTVEVPISVYMNSTWSETIRLNYNPDNNTISWTDPGIPVKFKVMRSYDPTPIYIGYGHSCVNNNLQCEDSINLYLVFDSFNNIQTDDSIYNGLSELCK